MTAREKNMISKLTFVNNMFAHTTTASGKEATVRANDMNLNKQYFSLDIEGKTVFTRGTIYKVFEVLNNN